MRPKWMERGTNEDAETRSVRVMKQGLRNGPISGCVITLTMTSSRILMY
jgi:hypothetical protein